MRRPRLVSITSEGMGFVVTSRSWAAGAAGTGVPLGGGHGRRVVGQHFVVRTAAGAAFAAPIVGDTGEDLVSCVNAHTPHLPYIWRPRSAEEVRLGVLLPCTRAPRSSGPRPA